MNRLNIKTAFVIILILILGVGIYLFLRTSKQDANGVSQDDKGFLSFFGERKTKPTDETTVPGAKPGSNNNDGVNNGSNSDSNSNNGQDGSTDNNSNGSNSNGVGNGSLSIKSIGTNQNGASNGSSGVGVGNNPNGSTNPNDPNNPQNGGVIVCPASNPNCNQPPVETIDCTPPKLPYTDEQIAQLKILVARFYNIAAGLKTQSDIQNEIDTRESYIEIVNQAHVYTNQCLAEIKAVKDGTNVTLLDGSTVKLTNKVIDNNPRWNPYLPIKFVKSLPASAEAINELNYQLNVYKNNINFINAQKNYLNNLGTSRNDAQDALLVKLDQDYKKAVQDRDDTIKKISDVKSGGTTGLKLLKGTFFPENKRNGVDYIASGRLNDDWDRRFRIYFAISKHLFETSNFWTTKNDGDPQQPWAIRYFFQGTSQSNADNPLYWLLSDIPNDFSGAKNEKEAIDKHNKGENSNPNAWGLKNFHRLQQLEDALGIW